MNIHYNTTTGQIVSYGFGADYCDGEDSHFPGCKVLIMDNQPIDARAQRVDLGALQIVAKASPDPEPDPVPQVRAAIARELFETDRFVLPDYPISELARAAWIAYRKALRDASKGNPSAAAMLAAIPLRPDGTQLTISLGMGGQEPDV